jgi:mannonate dehydratase
MELTFRWFGSDDPVPLEYIRQIPGVRGVVSALYDVLPGERWPQDHVQKLAATIDSANLRLSVVESIPVHEDIKLGRPSREKLVENYCESVRAIGEAGVSVLCYNFMPVFDWVRTDLATPLADGSNALSYDDAVLSRFDLSQGTGHLPGWATAYDAKTLGALVAAYSKVTDEQLWENLAWFLERVVPVAQSVGVRMAIHPDDPPWPILGIPRIITGGAAFERLIQLVGLRANGITFCTGSLAAHPDNDIPRMARKFANMGRIHFAHCRNIKRVGDKKFVEVPHPTEYGDVDMRDVLWALYDAGFSGPIRSDHGRMIWGENGRPGYGLNDRALGAAYLNGLWEGLRP